MAETLYYLVKSTTANYWYSVARGLWVEREDATQFNNRADAFAIAEVLRPTEQLPVHRIYVAAVRKRSPADRIRHRAESLLDALTDDDGSVEGDRRVVRAINALRAVLPSSEKREKTA